MEDQKTALLSIKDRLGYEKIITNLKYCIDRKYCNFLNTKTLNASQLVR